MIVLILFVCLLYITSNHGQDKRIPQHNLTGTNLIYVKNPKCASSTTSGVMFRIGEVYNLRYSKDIRKDMKFTVNNTKNTNTDYIVTSYGFQRREPLVWASHATMGDITSSIMSLTHAYFLVTWVRDPVDRCLSQFYHFKVSRAGQSNTTEAKLEFMKSKECKNAQYNYLHSLPSKLLSHRSVSDDADHSPISKLLSLYDFIGSVEKYDESMLLLAFKLNLSMCNILYIKSKDSHEGRFDDTRKKQVPHLSLSEEPKDVFKFSNSATFRSANLLDYELVNRVNAMIDKEVLLAFSERENFAQLLKIYKVFLESAQVTCILEPEKRLMDLMACYHEDSGCGYKCLDINYCAQYPHILSKKLYEIDVKSTSKFHFLPNNSKLSTG